MGTIYKQIRCKSDNLKTVFSKLQVSTCFETKIEKCKTAKVTNIITTMKLQKKQTNEHGKWKWKLAKKSLELFISSKGIPSTPQHTDSMRNPTAEYYLRTK